MGRGSQRPMIRSHLHATPERVPVRSIRDASLELVAGMHGGVRVCVHVCQVQERRVVGRPRVVRAPVCRAVPGVIRHQRPLRTGQDFVTASSLLRYGFQEDLKGVKRLSL